MRYCFKFIRYLANLPFALLVLIIIVIFSIFGSLIEQEQSLEFYENIYSQPFFGFVDYNLILNLGLDHIFKTWWFVGLLFVFGSSLTCCTFLEQLPTLKNVRRIKFYKLNKVFPSLTISTHVLFQSNGKVVSALLPKSYRVFQSLDKIYANKGIIGRISPIIVHFSMLLVLIGAIIATTSGFVAQELVPESEIFHIQNILDNNILRFVPNISGRVNDFWILYDQDYKIRQFYTDFSLLDMDGSEVKRETIYVNHPLKYKGLTFYQTDWNILASRIQYNLNMLPYQVPCLKHANSVCLTWLPLQPEIKNLSNSIAKSGYILSNHVLTENSSFYDNKGKMLARSELNEAFYSNYNSKLYDLITETGIQIKSDPGLLVIYFAFFLLIFSIIASYQSYSQIWIWPILNKLRVVGTSNRSKFEFELEILKLILKL